MDFMVAFKVDNALTVLIEKVVVQHQVVRSSVRAEADNRYLFWIEAVPDIQHHDLPRHEHTYNQPFARLRCRHNLAHPAGHWRIHMRLHRGEIKYRSARI